MDSPEIAKGQSEKLVGDTIDHQLCFEKFINNKCGKAKTKLKSLSPVAPFKNFNSKKTVMNAFLKHHSITVIYHIC